MNGQWITVPGESQRKNIYFRARKKIEITQRKPAQKLHIAAESYYMLWVNGKMLGRGPARGNRNVNFFDTYEIEQHLHSGENWIAVLIQSMNKPNYISAPAAAAVIIDIEGVSASGQDWEVLHNLEWREDVDIYTGQTGFCEYRNLRETPLGWETGNDQEKWIAADVIGKASDDFFGKKLLPRPIPQLRTISYQPVGIARTANNVSASGIPDGKIARSIDEAKHINVDGELSGRCTLLLTAGEHQLQIAPPENGDGVSITFDFRREIIGFLELKLTAPDGTQVDLCHDEELFDGRVIASRCGYNFADRYITRNGTQIVGNTLHERGFRLVEIVLRNFKEPVTLHSVQAIDRRYPFPQRGSFYCSDMLLNRIWDVCLETLSTCTTDVFTDCPWRERAFWVNDMMVENIVSLQAFGDYRLNAHALRFAISNRRKDGWMPGMCPDSGNLRSVLVPANLLVMLMLKDYYWYSGDSTLLNELLPEMLELLEMFEPLMDADHQIAPPPEMWNFVDWSYGPKNISHNGRNSSLLNWLYCSAVNVAAELLEISGDRQAAAEWRLRIPPVLAGIEKRFWQESKKMYSEFEETDKDKLVYSQLCHAFSLMSGALPEMRRADAIAALSSTKAITPELYMYHFILNQLRDHGAFDLALSYVREHWGGMIKTGTPTLWEIGVYPVFSEKRDAENAHSLCHGFCTTPVNYLQTAILGVRPLSPGFHIFEAKPEPHDLEFAEGSIPTPNGNIRMKWNREGDKIKINLFVPYGLAAKTAVGILQAGHHEFIQAMSNGKHM